VAGSRVERVRAAVEAWGGGDMDAFLALLDANFVVDWSRSTAPYAGVHRGRSEIERAVGDYVDQWDEYRLDILRLTETEDGDIVCELHAVARGGMSGVDVSGTGGLIWRFRGETPVSMEMFQNYDEAIAAVSPPRD
jgi:ketosteroid isomerase-like protein